MHKGWWLLGGLLVACGGSGKSDVTCGAGTQKEGAGCVAVLQCGPGTTQVDYRCELDGLLPKSCGPGTMLVDGSCVPNDAAQPLSCGPGTERQGDECLPTETQQPGAGGAPAQGGQGSALECGPGTYAMSGLCLTVPVSEGGAGGDSAPSCGPGTHEVSGECLPDGEHFQILIPDSTIQADGLSKVPVLAVGTDADGNPLHDSVLMFPSRVDAGEVAPATLALTDFGGHASFKPCNAISTPSCAGDFELRLVRVSMPSVILATTRATLVVPSGVGSTAQCKVGGNVLYLNGSPGDYIHQGEASITDGAFSASLNANSNNLHFHVDPANSNMQGLWWDVYFDSSKLGAALEPGVYDKAERWPFEGGNTPGLDVSGDGRGCNMLSGAFQIETLKVDSGALVEVTASFRQSCDGGPLLNGCLHYEAP